MDIKRKETIKFWIAMLIILIVISVVICIVIRYQVTGETNMPFELSKVTIISTAEGEQNKENTENARWNLNINQNNDIYFYITKNETYKKTAFINSIKIENIKIEKEPAKGNIKIYMPNSGEGRRFVYDDAFIVNESLTYTGSTETNEKNLTIGNQGGTIAIRIANCNIGSYISNEDNEIVHDGTLLKQINTTNEEVNFTVKFDLILDIDGIKYKAEVLVNLPYGNISDEGITKMDLDRENESFVFKRL